MIKFHVRHGMVVHKVHEVTSFKPSKWLEKCINFKTIKRKKTKIDFGKIFQQLLTNSFYGKTMERF